MNEKQFIVFKKTKIIDVLKLFNKSGYKSVLVLDKNRKLIGSLSEGDIRRSLLKNSTLKSNIDKIYNQKPFYVHSSINKKKLKYYFQKFDYDIIPILDKNGKILKIVPWNYSIKKKSPDLSKKRIISIVMAGGKGMRMKPFTSILPKPLLPVKGKAIIDHILEKLISNKFSKIYVSISKNSNILETYLEKYEKVTNLKFLRENKPLGTIGSIKKINHKIFDDILITNCDISLNLDLPDLYKFHQNYNNDMTIVVSKFSIKVPYGICEFNENGKFDKIIEKPTKKYFVICGMYILKKKVLKLIPKNKLMNADTLILKLKKENYKIGVYPIKQNFFNDVGEWDKYLKTIKNKIF